MGLGPVWYDIHSPHNKGVGKIEVENGKITKTSPAYRWALHKNFEEVKRDWDRLSYMLEARYACNCKSFDKTPKPVKPSDKQLFERVSP